ncbi:MAG: 1,4-dihydroxy-2-naphthoate octaprenyltransferase, partial [Gammaproteobacteria bacterium]|nr:1,4-dihydroxy-2-naphthoate octaprenyltransferase [Gammaproteobacteria bacterium]
MKAEVREGIWRLADPKISITSAAAMLVGVAPAIRIDQFSFDWLAVTALAMFCMEVAKNAWGDVIDFNSGTDLAVLPEDRTAFSGGKRVIVDG